jgi:hypothetical protein
MSHFVYGHIFKVDGASDGLIIARKLEFKSVEDDVSVCYFASERVGIEASDGYDTRSTGSL